MNEVDVTPIWEMCQAAGSIFILFMMFSGVMLSAFIPIFIGERLLKRARRLYEDFDDYRAKTD